MNIKKYLKRVCKSLLNRPIDYYSLEREYVVHNTDKRFAGKVAVVTGGSGALGGAIAKRLAIEGAAVFVCGRNIQKLQMFCDSLASCGNAAHPCKLDVTDLHSIKEAYDAVLKAYSHVDILVNCAGGSTRANCANLWEQSVEMIDEMLFTNLRGSILCTNVFGKKMVEQHYGKIINIASVIGEHGKPKFSDYAAAKAGVIGYTKSAAQEFGTHGVNVNCVSPGFIQRGEFNEEQLPYLLNSNFMHKIGTAEDVASAVAYLASDEAEFITGQNLCVDGGRSLGLHGD